MTKPYRNTCGELVFKDAPTFRPNLTPKQIFKKGSFGGTYFRPIYSAVTKKNYKNKHDEFNFLNDISDDKLTSPDYDVDINKYGVRCGTSLEFWESKHWIKAQDPYGWVQWYCRFYEGRRSLDDARQIKRWLAFAGPNGRFKRMLCNMVKRKKAKYDDYTISPVIRQSLLHWAYEIRATDI